MEICSGPDDDSSSRTGHSHNSPLSPIRGISYPPLSPKSLKRGFAIQHGPSGHPTLTKSHRHHVAVSAVSSSELSPSHCPAPPNITVITDQCRPDDMDTMDQKTKRGGRFDKDRQVDTRRYHTAGTIEDLKVGIKY